MSSAMNSMRRWFNERAWWEKSGAADYYRGLSQRDQRIAQGVFALLLATLLFLLVWQPIAHWREANQARFDDAQETLQWMHANQLQAQQNSTGQARAPGASLLAVVGDVARELGVTLTRFNPKGLTGCLLCCRTRNSTTFCALWIAWRLITDSGCGSSLLIGRARGASRHGSLFSNHSTVGPRAQVALVP